MAFHELEQPFARQARWLTLPAGGSGFYMTWRLNAWERFQSSAFWWMHAMVLTWLVFSVMLFVLEPLFLERLLARRAAVAPEATYRLVEWLHRGLLALSLLTVAGAVAGSIGGNLFSLGGSG
jgi:predicted PurR-regulated permease PerM